MSLTIQQAADRIKAQFKVDVDSDTVDTIKLGDPSQPVRGIAVTFMATRQVLEQTLAKGANFLITHEPTFYNHLDETDWLKDDAVYLSKKKFIEDNGLVVWRLHDYTHVIKPDMIFTGMVRELGWQDRVESQTDRVIRIPTLTLHDLALYCKEKLNIKAVRYAGDPRMPCSGIGLRVGSPGCHSHMNILKTKGVDVVITGESAEWETCEYVRDSPSAGENNALIVLGHANSEDGGVRWVAEWIQQALPEVTVSHVPAGDPFTFV